MILVSALARCEHEAWFRHETPYDTASAYFWSPRRVATTIAAQVPARLYQPRRSIRRVLRVLRPVVQALRPVVQTVVRPRARARTPPAGRRPGGVVRSVVTVSATFGRDARTVP